MLPYKANFTGCDDLMVRTDLHMAGYAKEIVLTLVPTVASQGMDNILIILGLSQLFSVSISFANSAQRRWTRLQSHDTVVPLLFPRSRPCCNPVSR